MNEIAEEMLALLIRLRDCGAWFSSALEIDQYGPNGEDGEELEEDIRALIDKAEAIKSGEIL